MPPEDYRYYRLDSDGQLHGADWFEADSDEDAQAQMQAKHPNGMCEIWQGQRFVAKIGAYPARDILSASRRTLAEARRVLSETASLVVPPRRPDSRGEAR